MDSPSHKYGILGESFKLLSKHKILALEVSINIWVLYTYLSKPSKQACSIVFLEFIRPLCFLYGILYGGCYARNNKLPMICSNTVIWGLYSYTVTFTKSNALKIFEVSAWVLWYWCRHGMKIIYLVMIITMLPLLLY